MFLGHFREVDLGRLFGKKIRRAWQPTLPVPHPETGRGIRRCRREVGLLRLCGGQAYSRNLTRVVRFGALAANTGTGRFMCAPLAFLRQGKPRRFYPISGLSLSTFLSGSRGKVIGSFETEIFAFARNQTARLVGVTALWLRVPCCSQRPCAQFSVAFSSPWCVTQSRQQRLVVKLVEGTDAYLTS